MAQDVGSTVPRRQLGRLLRQARTEAGVTLETAAEALEYSRQKIWRIECGTGTVRVLDVRAMCELYRVPAETTEVLRALAVQTRAKGWWQEYGDAVPSWYELYLGLESAAAHLRRYDESLVPDLLQTREYAYALPRATGPEVPTRDRAVDLRMQRQRLLTRRHPKPPRLTALVSEAALRRPVGGPEVMTDQLARLLETAGLATVSLRVVPLAAGPHPGATAGTFVIIDFSGPRGGQAAREPSVVYSESLTGALYLDKPDEVAAYENAWRSVAALALDESASTDLIKSIIAEGQPG
ncbi:DNA-binding protein [Micromonospora rosaria]|uniref:DNA-binding protein n=1 Tax=Micromonospora rosaria TaxID=47874 RepID=A0A136PQ06_9ACTN|nr:helix-turn-helix transcriptional regulator [Micromonospora rosaria]KXK60559.1 DNA-binding protein [Micromonospora rosaria]